MTSMLLALALAARRDTTPSPARDTVAELLSRDSASHVVLTARSLDFAFTGRGGRRVVRSADSAAAARTAWFDAAALTHQITEGVVRGMRMTFPLGAIDTVRAAGAELTVCFRPNASDAPDAPDAPRCAEGKRFVFDGTTPADVRRFADAVERARAAR